MWLGLTLSSDKAEGWPQPFGLGRVMRLAMYCLLSQPQRQPYQGAMLLMLMERSQVLEAGR
ncbi:hypothetical protein BH759_11350 [Ralstonia solanacearum]|nr:hypothetical protein BH759_11350 [Ralstonia solanacearum]